MKFITKIFNMDKQKQVISPTTSGSQITSLPKFNDLLRRAWQVYRARLGTFLGIMFLPVIVSLLSLIPETAIETLNPPFAVLLVIVFFLAVLIVSFWSQIALLFAIKEREQKLGTVEAFRKSWRKIVPFIWISVLSSLVVTGGFMLLIIPGVIFAIWFTFAGYVLVSENLKGMDALLRSRQLVKGNWGRVFGRFFLLGLILLLVLFPLAFILAFLFAGLEIPFLGDVAAPLMNLFVTPLTLTFAFLLYEDLKRQKGEMPFTPPEKRTKLKFIIVGILGVILIPAILIGCLWLYFNYFQ